MKLLYVQLIRYWNIYLLSRLIHMALTCAGSANWKFPCGSHKKILTWPQIIV